VLLLITRPLEESDRLAETLKRMGHDVVSSPMLSIVSEPGGKYDAGPDDILIITSSNALKAVREAPVFDRLVSRPVYCVGEKTGAALAAAGFRDVRGRSERASDLLDIIVSDHKRNAAGLADRQTRYLHLAGDAVAFDLIEGLRNAGLEAVRIQVYRGEEAQTLTAEACHALAASRVDAVLLYSPRTAKVFCNLILRERLVANLGQINALCLSPAVADGLGAIRDAFSEVAVARKPNGKEMLALVGEVAAQSGKRL